MLKILIVDDEKPIRQWFEYVIRQYEGEFEIAGLAANGQEAFELFLSAAPDIIITDIKMPVMDGLELLERVTGRSADVLFLILSNHDDFAFVRQGLRIGAKDYLLKAETDDQDIVTALRRIAGEHARRRAVPTPTKKEEELREGTGLLRDVLDHPTTWLPPAMAQSPMRWVYCGIDAAAGGDKLNLTNVLLRECRNRVATLFGQTLLYTDDQENVALLVGCPLTDKAPSDAEWTDLCMLWCEEVSLRHSHTISLGLSTSFRIAELQSGFQEAKRAYRYKFYTGERSVNFAEPNVVRAEDAAALALFMRPLKSAELLDADLVEQVSQKLDELKSRRFDPEDAIDAFRLFLERMEAQLPENARTAGGEESLRKFDEEKPLYWTELHDNVLRHLRSMRSLSYRHTFVYSAPTNRIIAYIRERYAEKISMAVLAEQVHLNENYLSQVFKKDTGTTISRFLIEVRMEQAKKQLSTMRYKVNEVAAEVGYASEAHFSTAYKMYYGLTPSQYLDSLRILK